MRIFLSVLILIFSLQSWTKADDISDFQIEGMSIGDSLLDYFSEKEIKKNTVMYEDSSDDITYKTVEIGRYDTSLNFNLYDDLIFAYKNKDNKFIIVSLNGAKNFENREDCYKKMDSVIIDLNKFFANIEPTKINIYESSLGISRDVKFIFETGDYISVKCIDYHKKIYEDHLRISMQRLDYMKWINEKAYN